MARIEKLNKKESYLQDDIISNLIFLVLICSKTNESEMLESIKSIFKLKHFSKQDIIKRIKTLYDRYYTFLGERSEFWFMSCKKNEKKNILTLFQNNKQIYCNIDLIYDCSLHSNIDPNFDNPSYYNEIKYLKTFKKLLEFSILYLFGENQSKNNIAIYRQTENKNNTKNHSINLGKIDNEKSKDEEKKDDINNNDDINDNDNINDNDDLISKSNIKISFPNNPETIKEIFNKIILKNKDGTSKIIFLNKRKREDMNTFNNNLNDETLKNRIIDLIFEFNGTLDRIRCLSSVIPKIRIINQFSKKEKEPCSELCYKNFLSCNKDCYNQIYLYLKDKEFPIIYELLLIKFIQMVKFDPCHINKLINAFISKDNNNLNFKINCYEIYIHLLSKKFSLRNIIKKKLFDLNLKEQELSQKNKSSLTQSQIRKIEEKNISSKNLGYIPCTHFGNEICDEKCICSKRGYCEIYCKCNPLLCNFSYNGCHCSKGDCSTNHCPCFIIGKECNSLRCKNCSNNKNNRCKNRQLQNNEEPKLIVGISNIEGWGLFANEDIKKECLIGEYKGELINNDIVNKRDRFRAYERSTYMFKLDDEYTVDSRRMGNMLRYANHSKINSNSYTKIVLSGGHRKIGLFAKKNIKKGEEILFNYDGQGILGEQFPWINNEKKLVNHRNINYNIIENNINNITTNNKFNNCKFEIGKKIINNFNINNNIINNNINIINNNINNYII